MTRFFSFPKEIFSIIALPLLALALLVTVALAAPSDGGGPWADQVISFSQGTNKLGDPVCTTSPNKCDPSASLGVAEQDNDRSHYFVLGFGGTITLKFDNGINDSLTVKEGDRNPTAPEKVKVEVSVDGITYYEAGRVTNSDDRVRIPSPPGCARFVRLTDISNPNDYTSDRADGFDLDGVRANGDVTLCALPPLPDEDPTPTLTPTATPTPGGLSVGGPSDPGGTGNNSSCTATKPSTPVLTSVVRTGNTAILSWTPVPLATYYTIAYGTSSGNYAYGVANTGNTTTFSVGGLNPGTAYYFVVRAVNDCTPGDFSNEDSTVSTRGLVLGASTQIGPGRVLGASTDILAGTGVTSKYLRLMLSGFSGLFFYILLRLRFANKGISYIHARATTS